MPAMTSEQYRQFLAEGTRTAKLATVRRDGRPHIAPVWFVLDGESVVFTTGKKSVKGQDIRRDPRVAICVDDETMPFAMVVVEGLATFSEDRASLLDWATRIAARYVGAQRAAEFGRRNGGPGEILVRVAMDKVLAYGGMAG
jgi:PPOX class probable F420-dependent enzyme